MTLDDLVAPLRLALTTDDVSKLSRAAETALDLVRARAATRAGSDSVRTWCESSLLGAIDSQDVTDALVALTLMCPRGESHTVHRI